MDHVVLIQSRGGGREGRNEGDTGSWGDVIVMGRGKRDRQTDVETKNV